ncbi:MAG: hypothetical protein L0214_14380 [candidate division NC10 bacterium]|nr:hypothetical protein [candidate division NC10 bacterium]
MFRVPRDVKDETQLSTFLEAAKNYLADEYFTRKFSSVDFRPDDASAGPSFIYPTNNRAGVWAYDAALEERAMRTFPRPDLWINGDFRVRMWYSGGTAAAGTNIVWQVKVVGHSETGNLSAGTLLVTQTITAPGPVVAEDLDVTEFYVLTAPITAAYELLNVEVARRGIDGSDNYAGEGYFVALTLQYYPRDRQ